MTGWNAVQVQRFLGHHKPSFTLDVYVHLLDEDVPEPPRMGNGMGNTRATQQAETGRDDEAAAAAGNSAFTGENLAVVRAV